MTNKNCFYELANKIMVKTNRSVTLVEEGRLGLRAERFNSYSIIFITYMTATNLLSPIGNDL